jgi:hypothetical protein
MRSRIDKLKFDDCISIIGIVSKCFDVCVKMAAIDVKHAKFSQQRH